MRVFLDQNVYTILQQYQPSLDYDTLSEKIPRPRAGQSEISTKSHRPTGTHQKIFKTQVSILLALAQRHKPSPHANQSVEQIFSIFVRLSQIHYNVSQSSHLPSRFHTSCHQR